MENRVTGVTFNRATGKYKAYIQSQGYCRHLGYHTTFEAAKAARQQAEAKLRNK